MAWESEIGSPFTLMLLSWGPACMHWNIVFGLLLFTVNKVVPLVHNGSE